MRVLLLLALALLLPFAAGANVEAGLAKWRQGDWAGAVSEWSVPAARGDPEALFNMGQAHRLGRGVTLDRAMAIDFYRRAAEKGHVPATANLGITLWQEGRKTEALIQLRNAADRGDLRASYVLGVATFEGDVAPRNPALGYAYVVRAREGGLALASGQAARMAARMSADDRARGDAAAAALVAGRPVAVVLAQLAAPVAADQAEPALLNADSGEDEAETAAAPAVAGRKDESEAAKPSRTMATAKAAPVSEEPSVKDEGPSKAAAAGWKVQLGAYANERSARTAWATLISQSADLLKGQKPVYAPRGGLVRLQIGPFDERSRAAELCARLSAAGRPCFVTK